MEGELITHSGTGRDDEVEVSRNVQIRDISLFLKLSEIVAIAKFRTFHFIKM